MSTYRYSIVCLALAAFAVICVARALLSYQAGDLGLKDTNLQYVHSFLALFQQTSSIEPAHKPTLLSEVRERNFNMVLVSWSAVAAFACLFSALAARRRHEPSHLWAASTVAAALAGCLGLNYLYTMWV